MLHKTVQKCQYWQSTPFWLMTCSVDVAERHTLIDQADDPLVRERHVKDVGRQIPERSCASSDLPTIHHPRLAPNCACNLGPEVCLAQCRTQLGAKQDRQGLEWHEEAWVARMTELPIRS